MYTELERSHTDSGGRTDLSENDRHRLLASERRRLVLAVLRGRRRPVELDEGARWVVAREGGDADDERVRISLHHQHLPLMDDLGVVDYDPETNLVAPNADRLDPLARLPRP